MDLFHPCGWRGKTLFDTKHEREKVKYLKSKTKADRRVLINNIPEVD